MNTEATFKIHKLHEFTTLEKKLHSIDYGVYSLHAIMGMCF